MLQNINNEKYVQSFLSQQPIISYTVTINEGGDDYDNSILATERHDFKYGSWKYNPLNISNKEKETVVLQLKEKYIFNDKAKERLDY